MSRRPRIGSIATDFGTTGFLEMGENSSRPLLLLHGFAGDKLTWQFFFQSLSKISKLYALDLPGHGTTECPQVWEGWHFVDWLKATTDALSLDNPHIIAHSMGGRIALDYAAEHPTSGLHLLSCAGLTPQFNSTLLKDLAKATSKETIEKLVRQMIGQNERLVAATTKAMQGKLALPSHAAAMAAIIEASTTRSQPENFTPPAFQRINTLLHFFWGDMDRIVPAPADLPAQANCTIVRNAGHMLPLEAPGPIVSAIKKDLSHA